MRTKPGYVRLFLVASFVLLGQAASLAQVNETPYGHKYYIFAPYRFQFDDGEQTFEDWVGPAGQHYGGEHYVEGIDVREGEDRTNPTCRLDRSDSTQDFLGVITAGADAGIILLTGHGGTTQGASYGVEVYDKTEAGWAQATAAVLVYQTLFGYDDTYIYRSSDKKDAYHGVWITKNFVGEEANLAGSGCIVYHSACHGGDGWAAVWTGEGARFAVGPVGSPSFEASKQGVELFSQCLNGWYGIENRNCAAATEYADDTTEGLTLGSNGYGNTVLAPAVTDWFPREVACTLCGGYVEFDCTMDTDAERTEGVVYGSGCVNVGDVEWESDHKVTFPFTAGTGWSVLLRVNAQKAVSANNAAIQLDGNMLPYPPYSTNGVAPNEDNFQWTVDCCYDIYVTVTGFGTTGAGPCGPPACASRNNGCFTLTWNALGSRWEGYASPCGNRYLYYDSGDSRWEYCAACMCGVIFYNDASNADWPPKTGWYPQSGHICGSGSMTLDYCGCD